MTIKRTKKLVQKLPDWAISRWNRQVTQSLTDNREYPTFKEFATFVSTEAEIACNPITSFHALRNSELAVEKVNPKETKRSKVWVLTTQFKRRESRCGQVCEQSSMYALSEKQSSA